MEVMRRLNTCSSNICDASYMEFLVLCYWQVPEPIAPPAVDWLRIRSVEAALVNLRGAATRLDWTGRRGRCTSIRIEGVPVGSTSLRLLVLYSERKGYGSGDNLLLLLPTHLWACGYCGLILDELAVSWVLWAYSRRACGLAGMYIVRRLLGYYVWGGTNSSTFFSSEKLNKKRPSVIFVQLLLSVYYKRNIDVPRSLQI